MGVIIKESTFQDFELLTEKVVVLDLSAIGKAYECSFPMLAFAYPSDTSDTYKNDFIAPLFPLTNSQINPHLYLEKKNEDCTWTEIQELTDTTYGDPKAIYNTNTNWIGTHIDAWKVYNTNGSGCYRIRLEYDNIVAGDTEIVYSYRYEVKLWNENLADETTRMTYTVEGGKLGDEFKDDTVINYNTSIWTRQIRVDGIFGYKPSMSYETEYTRYKNGAQVYTDNNGVEKYPYLLKGLPFSLHMEVSKTVMLSDKIIIDDYNIENVNQWQNKQVTRTSGYEPNYDKYVSFSSVELEFSQYFENNRRKRC
jgi:hypothetical protein